ncbi:glycoside hydrolase [Fulvivirga sediminis]|uniref:Xylanase n=1 Tax=Fulvivirga sediminis TaxID=2803949 RepID=A0A937JYM6_9BACT|nr:glycoside hydrolase [Fulvivirga sediminis]MBL3655839.1 xylanase [Fulvivirga sediminis]
MPSLKIVGVLMGILLFPSLYIKDQTNTEDHIITYHVDTKQRFQTIDNFGASDAWSCQFVGNWPLEKKQKIAELLFSKEMDQAGNPKGIGLSLWRFNLGAGSAHQGDLSGIKDEWRRSESFLQKDGDYDWTKQSGQVWFAQEAKKYEVENLLIFNNSPHINFTKNGKAFTDSGKHSNLSASQVPNFAKYLVKSAEGLEKMGLTVDYISPINEPQWDWQDGGQEGTPFWNEEVAQVARQLNKELKSSQLKAKIDIAEAAQINYLYEVGNKPGRANHINDFFNQQSDNYLGDLENVSHTISGHSYFTTAPKSTLTGTRNKLFDQLQNKPDLKYWMSEYCILGDNHGEIDGNGRDLGIDPALHVAKVIHTDLTLTGASAWHWWLAVSPYDYKDGLVYIDHNKTDGQYYQSKMMWAFGNYSRFVRPGYIRVAAKSADEAESSLMVSGYINPQGEEMVIVAVNPTEKDTKVNLNVENHSMKLKEAFETSKNHDLEKVDLSVKDGLRIPAQSIVTLIY